MKKIISIALCAMFALSIMGCSDGGSDYETYDDTSLSKEEQQERAVEEELSHYYYDENGHLHDDRD